MVDLDEILEDVYSPAQDLARLMHKLAESETRTTCKAPDLELVLNPYQSDFLTCPDRGFTETLYSGSVGGGKSLSLCLALLRYVSVPNTTVLLCRYELSALKKSTLRTLLCPEPQHDGTLRSPLLPAQAIANYNKSDSVMTLHNGSCVIMTGTQDVEKVRSINSSAAFVEEASELTLEQWTAVQQRCRLPCQLPNAIMACTNPKAKSHFLYQRFKDSGHRSRRMITVNAYSNPHLSKAYVQMLEELPEPERSRMLMGEWCDAGSLVFPCFKREHIRACADWPTRNPGAITDYIIAQDYGGGSGYAAAVLLGRGRDGATYCLAQYYNSKSTHAQMLKWMEQYRELARSVVVYDSANAALKLDMENAGWTCVPCLKDIEGSVGIVNDRFKADTLYIDPSLKELVSQLEDASRVPGTGAILKLKDWDLIDAFRYGVVALTTPTPALEQKRKQLFFVPD